MKSVTFTRTVYLELSRARVAFVKKTMLFLLFAFSAQLWSAEWLSLRNIFGENYAIFKKESKPLSRPPLHILYLVMREFADDFSTVFAATNPLNDRDELLLTEPPSYTLNKLSQKFNPQLKVINSQYNPFDQRVNLFRDNISIAIIDDAKNIFRTIRDYQREHSELLDRLIIEGHGTSDTIGQYHPEKSLISSKKIRKLSPGKYGRLIKPDGFVWLFACLTDQPRTDGMKTIAQVISNLLKAKTIAAQEIVITTGMVGAAVSWDNELNELVVDWSNGTVNIQNDFVLINPFDPSPKKNK